MGKEHSILCIVFLIYPLFLFYYLIKNQRNINYPTHRYAYTINIYDTYKRSRKTYVKEALKIHSKFVCFNNKWWQSQTDIVTVRLINYNEKNNNSEDKFKIKYN